MWDRLAQYGSLGGIDPEQGSRGSAQRYAQFGAPHPDAEAIEIAVGKLGVADWRQDFEHIAGELAALVSVNQMVPRLARGRTSTVGKANVTRSRDGRGLSVVVTEKPRDVLLLRSINVSALVTTHAVMGTRPDWLYGVPRPCQTPALRGGGAAIVGECRGKNLYATGTYCPIRWAPSPIDIVLDRADYHVWHQALTRLAAELVLTEHVALPPAASPAPWLTPEKPHRIYSYAVAQPNPLPLKPQRELAGPPLSKYRRRDRTGPLTSG